ncbi:MAG TPA: MogA/MoaB family molybdenum cofactor biosynthesis protein [Anaerolineaceae bacterium]|nr:MogA/MoaB family molybdenum cofactor biosynthesis protein [Anaerolineaceae bacterium]
MTEAIRVAVLISSDKGAKGEREDLSGPAIAEKLQGLAEVVATAIVADNKDLILEKLIYFADRLKVDIVFTSGGTGLAPRDVTPEATLLACERIVPGITDAMRLKSFEVTDRAMLSRAVAGTRGKTLIINLPGSPKAVKECLDVFLPVIEHAVETLRGEAYECAR